MRLSDAAMESIMQLRRFITERLTTYASRYCQPGQEVMRGTATSRYALRVLKTAVVSSPGKGPEKIKINSPTG
jgi:hypothetical protein